MTAQRTVRPDGRSRSVDDRMHVLQRRANVVRSRLLRALDALDARRHQVASAGRRATKAAGSMAISVAGIAVIFGVSIVFFGMAWRARHRPFRRRLTSGFSKAVERIDRARRPSLGRRIFDKVMLTLVSVAGTELAKRATHNVFDGRLLDGRVAVGRALGAHHEELSERERRSR